MVIYVIGRKVNSEQKLNLNLSPKYQALNLIIAEYLLQQVSHVIYLKTY